MGIRPAILHLDKSKEWPSQSLDLHVIKLLENLAMWLNLEDASFGSDDWQLMGILDSKGGTISHWI